MALRYEDFACPPSLIVCGLAEGDLKEILLKAQWIKDAGCEVDENFFPKGKYKTFVFGDVTKMQIQLEAILVFGNPAQVGRLIQARTHFGGKIGTALFSKTSSCFEALGPAINGEVAISIPGAGDRAFSGISEDEMIVAMPYEWMERIVEGLRNTGKGVGLSYPIASFLFFTPKFPKLYREAQEKFMKI